VPEEAESTRIADDERLSGCGPYPGERLFGAVK
jgi:hypothetical protein